MNRIARFVLTVAALLANPAGALDIETLLMPGELIQGHARYESGCRRCHTPFAQGSQDQLCRDCHEEIDADVRARTGFHGRDPAAGKAGCSRCHTDHKGRRAEIVPEPGPGFAHDRTDFRLEGVHARAACASCHEAGKPERKTPHECVACHKDDDAHEKKLGDVCEDCHDARGWRETRFDHDETRFALEGAHEKLACGDCHSDKLYSNTPRECIGCHREDDVHAGRFGKGCVDCHGATEWKKTRFDHDRKTDWPLDGAHEKVACARCHSGSTGDGSAGRACVDCHRAGDVHGGRNGERCADCHTVERWSEARFDHDRKTDFPLRGAHRDAVCTACHKGKVDEKIEDTRCIACHESDDVHRGEQGEECARCHDEAGWGGKVRFDHDFARFPLAGLHAGVACEACHASGEFREAPVDCRACHEQEDMHKGALGEDCATCHNPNGWAFWRFDHDRQTDYPLDGAHEERACGDCHRTPVSRSADIALPVQCVECHAEDDPHQERFGRVCEQCHTTGSFRDVRAF